MKNGKPMAMSYKTNEAKKYQHDFTEYVKKTSRITTLGKIR